MAVALDALAGEVLEVELVEGESADTLRAFLQGLQTEYGMEVLVSDDQDSYKVLADELALEHSICRAHVNRNAGAPWARITGELAQQALQADISPPPGVMRTATNCPPTWSIVNGSLRYVHPRVRSNCHNSSTTIKPHPHRLKALWYRFRLALLRWSNNWQRLTFDQRWNRQHEAHLDGTNNVAERAIGRWIKERYRTMRTYKRPASLLNLARLISDLAAHPDQPRLAHLLTA